MPDAGETPTSTARRSKCADEARAAELARVRAMTPTERMALALALGRRQRALKRRLARLARSVT